MEHDKVGERLRTARKLLSCNQSDFAETLNVTQALLSRIEKGLNTLSWKQAKKLSDTYDINPYWLLEGIGSSFKKPDQPPLSDSLVGAVLPKFNGVTHSFKISTESMRPELQPLDTALCREINRSDLALNSIYYFQTDKYKIFRTLKAIGDNYLTLSAYAGDTIDIQVEIEEIVTVYKIIYLIRKYEQGH